MVTKQEFHFESTSSRDRLHGIRWEPEGRVVAVMQILHGMADYIDRYDEFARYLAQRGVLVVGHSHLGHGHSVRDAGDLGYFAQPDGNACVVADIHALRTRTQAEHPDVPYLILGHSMGSFLLRQYLCKHPEGLAGAVIMGTGDMPPAVLKGAKLLCTAMAKVKGWRYRSQLVNGLVVGGYEKKLGPGWLSKSAENVRRYTEDPLCGFCLTLNGFYGLFTGFQRAVTGERAGKIPKGLPVLFVAGAEDPVGNCGKAVTAVFHRYAQAGAKARMKLYPGDRHEILNEDDRQEVFADIWNWIEKEVPFLASPYGRGGPP